MNDKNAQRRLAGIPVSVFPAQVMELEGPYPRAQGPYLRAQGLMPIVPDGTEAIVPEGTHEIVPDGTMEDIRAHQAQVQEAPEGAKDEPEGSKSRKRRRDDISEAALRIHLAQQGITQERFTALHTWATWAKAGRVVVLTRTTETQQAGPQGNALQMDLGP